MLWSGFYQKRKQQIWGSVVAGNNIADGSGVLISRTTGVDNTGIGFKALNHDSSGNNNTAEGFGALFSNSGASGNTANGYQALFRNTTGFSNTAIGDSALLNSASGNGNVALGGSAGSAVTTASGVICIGDNVAGANDNSRTYIGNIYTTVQPIAGINPDYVTVNSAGRLGRGNISSRRYKHDIKPMENASEPLFGLKPVTFRYNKEYDATQTLVFGLIAEDVAKVEPELVGCNDNGHPESVRYEQINAMLLNEFLKEHRKVQQLESTIAKQEAIADEQQKEIKALTASLKEQASQIQEVSAQLEVSKPRTTNC